MSTQLSVVVPTFNRLEVLPEVLAALGEQIDAPPFEVVVVDDGSTDGTAGWLSSCDLSVPLVFETQENRGPAAARNRGVQLASGEVIAFLGDDTVPLPTWLATHWQAQSEPRGDERPVAVIGYTGWHPRTGTNPFLRYINEYGLQFGYALIDTPNDVPFNFLYTSNLSIPRRLLVEEPFDEGFPFAAWEDTELSYRLEKRFGLRLVYRSGARVLHDHPTSFERFCERQRRAGYNAVVFYQRHPELGSLVGLSKDGPPPEPPAWKRRLGTALARSLQNLPVNTPSLWEGTLRCHYVRGLHQGWADQLASPV